MKEGINYNNCKYEMERPSHCATHLLSRYRNGNTSVRKSKIWLVWIRVGRYILGIPPVHGIFPRRGSRQLIGT